MAVIELRPDAEQELDRRVAWHDGRGAGVGEGTFRSEIRRCLALIAEAPERWPLHPVRRQFPYPLRRYVMQQYPYALVYYVRGDTVIVVAIAHTSQKPNYWLKRLK